MSRIDTSESSSATEEITANEHKLNQIGGDFLKAFINLGRRREIEQVFQVATLFSILENDPLDPLYKRIDHIKNILKYVCAEYESPTKEIMRSDLKQLVAQHLSRNSDVAVGDSVEVGAGTSVEPIKSDSLRPNKRPISRSETEPSKSDVQSSDVPKICVTHYERTSSSSTTVDQQLLPPNRILHPYLNNPSLDPTADTDVDYGQFYEFVSSPYPDGNP
ncbi:10724_t:CDS:2 [Paraglomus brasilianum]|uniref:10724_t:CDS:1 n=1 Tax=Paraglomus brasilianum TaxID=144538 RepID=A0A9N9DNK3_9GLOM|nr:10724_t:CDS:2 [Paraglomus brasilianum]